MMKKIKVGVIGCGNISGIYFKNGKKLEILDIVACSDLYIDRAKAKAEEFGIPKACTVEELLSDPEIQIVLNLTIPLAHAEVSLAALEAGKHVYSEKPLAVTREEGQKILDLAKKKGLLVGCAPDTFMGAGIQTCRKLIDDGWIGEPIGATAFMTCHGHESWHPDPEFYYKVGGGPMLDMGPYYLTALVNLIGPIKRVTGSARITFPERIITSAPKYGTKITVDTPTHIAGVIDFENGAIGTIITSFDVWAAQLPRIEIYGAEGSLSVPDPNTFGGPVYIRRKNASAWSEVPLTHGYSENSRGIGLADMAYALLSGRQHRANGDMAYHVLDVMHGFLDASESGKHYVVPSTCIRPAPLPMGLPPNVLDE
ncbi:MAG TPA: Gfo/Idh/MocA family oxidoreductase [Clostridiaceae bacterium]|nr:Gfo/Idh/MocA family oxidoreductase [Clostridiaceae bacterium]